MAVLVEGISVVIKASAIASKYPEGWEGLKKNLPNQTLCPDGELVRVGFMSPDDVKTFVESLEEHGLIYLHQGKAQDLVIIDQTRGLTTACDWIEFEIVDWKGDPQRKVSACHLVDSKIDQIFTPDGWNYEESLSKHFGFVPTENRYERLVFIEQKNGCNVYIDLSSGREVFIGTTKGTKSKSADVGSTGLGEMPRGSTIEEDPSNDVIVPPNNRLPDLINWMKINLKSPVKIETLGRRSVFTAGFDQSNSSLVITTSSGKTHSPLAFKSIEKIFQRYVEAPADKRHMPSYYEIQTWEEAPDMIGTPYVPAIIRKFFNDTKL
jgi:hypothetical protein